jgi:CheY-like chemotaxis protein
MAAKIQEKVTVLLVEDDPNDIRLMQRAFAKANYNVSLQAVLDGEEGMNYLAGAKAFEDRESYPFPILIILDLKLPRKSGFELLEWIKQTPSTKFLPVIVFTSSQQPRDISKAFDLGANAYLAKPIGFENLLDTVHKIVDFWVGLNQMVDR